MKKKSQKCACAAILLVVFAVWTAAVCLVDVQPIGPQGLLVGLASLNRFFHDFTGVHMALYTVTDWLSLIPLGVVMGFALLGLSQWAKRKSLLKVDRSILVLGAFYAVVLAAFAVFEVFPINYRPVLIDGALEASYPSSTTMLVLCVMPTAAMQCRARLQNRTWKRYMVFVIYVFSAFMVIARLLSGVHWLTDIIGGVLLSAGLVGLYDAGSGLEK